MFREFTFPVDYSRLIQCVCSATCRLDQRVNVNEMPSPSGAVEISELSAAFRRYANSQMPHLRFSCNMFATQVHQSFIFIVSYSLRDILVGVRGKVSCFHAHLLEVTEAAPTDTCVKAEYYNFSRSTAFLPDSTRSETTALGDSQPTMSPVYPSMLPKLGGPYKAAYTKISTFRCSSLNTSLGFTTVLIPG